MATLIYHITENNLYQNLLTKAAGSAQTLPAAFIVTIDV